MSRMERFYCAELRINSIFDIGSQLACDGFDSKQLPDMIEDVLGANKEHLHSSVRPLYDAINDQEEAWMVGEVLSSEDHLQGLLLEVCTPVHNHFRDGGYSFSWGHCYVGVVYGETYEKAVKHAISWAKEKHKKDALSTEEAA